MDNLTGPQASLSSAPKSGSSRKIESLGGQQYVALTTYRRSGIGVITPVSPIVRDGKLYFLTTSHAGKVKRLRNNARVTLASSSANGKIIGPNIEGRARLLADGEFPDLRAEIRRAWGFLGFFMLGLQDLRRKTRFYYEVVDI